MSSGIQSIGFGFLDPGAHCTRSARFAVLGGYWRKASVLSDFGPTGSATSRRPCAPASAATAAALATEQGSQGGDGAGPTDTADPDAVLDGFVSAFSLPRQQLRMVLERQPGLQRANPQLLAQRIDAYTRATGLDAYQLLYMVARQPTFLRLSPSMFKERCEALAKSLALGLDDVLKLLVSQPAFLEVQPDSLRAVSGRVAGELGVRPGAALRVLARLPPGELRGVFTRQQPGLLRERLTGLRRMLLRMFGPRRATPEAALLLVARCPPLLALPTKYVESSLAALMSIPPTKGAMTAAAAAGGGGSSGRVRGRSRMLRAILSCPHVLTLPPETLRSRFVMLAAATRIDMPAVISMLLLQPRLLLADPARVRQRLEGLTFSLMVPRSAALDMVVRQPQLLLYTTESLAENWAGLQQLLGITFDSALSIVTRHPNILCTSPVNLTSKLAALESIFALPRPRAVLLAVEKPIILTMSEQRFQNTFRVLAPILALPSPAHLGRLVCREPYLLLESTVQLTGKVSLAASLLGISESDVGGMLARSPNFITKELSYWQTNLDTVTGGLGVSLERAREVAVRHPYLLAAEPTELLRVASANMALVRSSPAWMSALEGADAESLFKCLAGFNDRNREHLQYLADAGLQSQVSFLHPVIWDRVAFTKRFPRFANWQAEQRAATTARNGLPLPRRPPAWPPALSADAAAAAADASGDASESAEAAEENEVENGSEPGVQSAAESVLHIDVRNTVAAVFSEAATASDDVVDSELTIGKQQQQQQRHLDFASGTAGGFDLTDGKEVMMAVGGGRGAGTGPAGMRKYIPRRRQSAKADHERYQLRQLSAVDRDDDSGSGLAFYPRGAEASGKGGSSTGLTGPWAPRLGHWDCVFVTWRFTVFNMRGLQPNKIYEGLQRTFCYEDSDPSWGYVELTAPHRLADPAQGWLDEQGALHLRIDFYRADDILPLTNHLGNIIISNSPVVRVGYLLKGAQYDSREEMRTVVLAAQSMMPPSCRLHSAHSGPEAAGTALVSWLQQPKLLLRRLVDYSSVACLAAWLWRHRPSAALAVGVAIAARTKRTRILICSSAFRTNLVPRSVIHPSLLQRHLPTPRSWRQLSNLPAAMAAAAELGRPRPLRRWHRARHASLMPGCIGQHVLNPTLATVDGAKGSNATSFAAPWQHPRNNQLFLLMPILTLAQRQQQQPQQAKLYKKQHSLDNQYDSQREQIPSQLSRQLQNSYPGRQSPPPQEEERRQQQHNKRQRSQLYDRQGGEEREWAQESRPSDGKELHPQRQSQLQEVTQQQQQQQREEVQKQASQPQTQVLRQARWQEKQNKSKGRSAESRDAAATDCDGHFAPCSSSCSSRSLDSSFSCAVDAAVASSGNGTFSGAGLTLAEARSGLESRTSCISDGGVDISIIVQCPLGQQPLRLHGCCCGSTDFNINGGSGAIAAIAAV
ncbi:hypothetical protein VOLCADRAFT_127379 [Volvox carteri f. nagariensis]|uniref:Uncharacterized protein n=1 Tax=Volvox carteri f. nagariensis TaxID=3068 RepID=D8THP4_VOLCA|nr:uncharacterized protein VOLCADRAFT_127379 [Volvox carteri f. nagariensis]EFJ53103.1 hypothetical protein VOLCADRAFT_127379 [Volvox carteri f. nagariensis]|eukprot:XP_002946108.1 hypothetical protein VOLCADRAFT_127379 [Volvox carteri f. nagariensis]